MIALLKNSWKGKVTLGKAFWVVYVTFGIIVRIVVGLLVYLFMRHPVDMPLFKQILLVCAFPYTLFSTISVWKCSKNSSSKVWRTLTKIFLVLVIVMDVLNIGVLIAAI